MIFSEKISVESHKKMSKFPQKPHGIKLVDFMI